MKQLFTSIRSLFTKAYVTVGVALALSSLGGAIVPAVASAAAYDSAVILSVRGYNNAVSFSSTNHALGDCSTAFTVSSTRTCSGFSIGTPDGLDLKLSSSPYGYKFNGFTIDYDQTNGSNTCNGNPGPFCYLNFDSGTIKIYADFVSTTPTSPSLSVTNRSIGSVSLSWSQSSSPIGINGYRIYDGSTQIGSNSASNHTFTHSGLTCNSNHAYTVVAFNNDGSTASNQVGTSTLACPTSTGGSGGGSGSTGGTPTTTGSTGGGSTTTSGGGSTTRGTSTSGSAPKVASANTSTSNSSTNSTVAVSDTEVATNSEGGTLLDEAATDEVASTTVATSKKHLPNWAKLVIGIMLLAAGLAIARIIQVRRANNGTTDYWSNPPQGY